MRRLCVAAAVVGYGITVPVHAQADRSALLLARARAYLQEFVARLANVVAEEHYVQETYAPRRKRHLRSDFLLVKAQESSGGLLTFRDVLEVDGKPVHDRDDRLTKLFLQPADQRLAARARQINEEGARYNLTDIGTLNNPLTAVAFLQPRYRDHFRFLAGTNDKKVGPTVWTLQFTEFRRPTILKTNENGDLPARGNLWVDEDTGRIVKSELRVGATRINTVRITTTFGFDERLQVHVPIEMREFYPNDGGTYTIATYSLFRRFDVTTEETIR
jgi:hypothetical protein